MARKIIIFGNGLGMALDHEHFNLTNAIQSIWDNDNILSDDERQYILQCLPGADNRPPEGEHELDILHVAVTACGFLRDLSGDNVDWLSDEGRDFPITIAKFVHKVATVLHNYDGELPEKFTTPLCDFLRDTNSHVATLNYDKLLYGEMIDRNVLQGYGGALVDGMLNAGFSRDNLERKNGNNFGYYLHLHGSPLFYNDGNATKKKQRNELILASQFIGPHIVLTHIKHKLSVISSSEVLSTYWDYLDFALSESEEIIVFGCSGEDKHLNQKLKLYSRNPEKTTLVVEWRGAGEDADRDRYWKSKLGDRVELLQLDNILDFTDWE